MKMFFLVLMVLGFNIQSASACSITMLTASSWELNVVLAEVSKDVDPFVFEVVGLDRTVTGTIEVKLKDEAGNRASLLYSIDWATSEPNSPFSCNAPKATLVK